MDTEPSRRRAPPTLSSLVGGGPRSAVARRYLRAGQLLISWSPCEITTVLGSCVAVTFFCAPLGLGGVCHALLPGLRHGDSAADLPRPERWRYVECAVPELIDCFCPPGVRSNRVEVKLFGGSQLLTPRGSEPSATSVGAGNVAAARRLLAAAGLTIAAEDVGGDRGRKVIFNTATGDVRVKLLGRGDEVS